MSAPSYLLGWHSFVIGKQPHHHSKNMQAEEFITHRFSFLTGCLCIVSCALVFLCFLISVVSLLSGVLLEISFVSIYSTMYGCVFIQTMTDHDMKDDVSCVCVTERKKERHTLHCTPYGGFALYILHCT